jgi:hypothetical protein
LNPSDEALAVGAVGWEKVKEGGGLVTHTFKFYQGYRCPPY